MNAIRLVVEASIASEKLADYKVAVAKVIERIKASEPDTLGFAVYFNDDERICYFFEEYKNSEAVFTHLENSGDLIMPLIEMHETIRSEVYGNPSEALRQTLEPYGVTFLKHWQSLSR